MPASNQARWALIVYGGARDVRPGEAEPRMLLRNDEDASANA
ncbi:hypothetical protein [Sphingosinicella rhizophila]|uniref:Uncharacterized protein n=1 Tax=Sphingosinicella rhizophila TaxID=3050082 RepID=A0ABU3QBU8_9SPHN|nr:hypothetical protein [Sphingosinicella sp. GR2756]MDT9600807.1 hypothetical protein [Sphingosinicella sp. GR2756]